MLTGILRNTPRALMLVSGFFFVAAYFALRFPDAPGTAVFSYLAALAIALPSALALFGYLGTRRAALSLLALAAFAYAIETIGVVTGFPYGEFYYGGALGPEALGLVPYLLPVSYLPLVIGAVAAAWGAGGRFLHVIVAAVLLTLVDGVLDPGAVALGFWVWTVDGVYYGVPPGNYLGWLLSGALAAGVALLVGGWEYPPLPALLDSAILAVSFWTGVAVFASFTVPAVLGIVLFLYLLQRRSRFSGGKLAVSSGTGYKVRSG